MAIDNSNIPALSIPLDLLDSLYIGNDTIRIASSFYRKISQALSYGLQDK